MLYTQRGLRTNLMTPSPKDLAYYLENYRPERINLSGDSLAKYKATNIYYAFAGELKNSIRKNANVLNRTAVALDLDFITEGLDDFTLYDSLKLNLNFKWWLYPTISNGFKGLRYRLIIPLATPIYSEEDYKTLVAVVNYALQEKGILTRVDPSNKTWAQLFGLPVANQHYPASLDLVRSKPGELFPSDGETLATFKDFLKTEGIKASSSYSPSVGRISSKKKTYTAKLLTDFIQGITEGNRNNKMLELASYLIGIGLDNSNNIYNFLQVMNANYITPPLDNKELTSILKSAIKLTRRTNTDG